MQFTSINPATNVAIRSYDAHTNAEVDARISRAATAFSLFRKTSFADRTSWMMRAAELLESEKSELARLMTSEMGKTLRSAEEEIVKCVWVCRHYAESAEDYLAGETIEAGEGNSLVTFQPMGIILAIMPWNFPMWQVFRFIAPSLMAGNVVLLKHAANVQGCALRMEEIVERAGFPGGVFQTLLIGVEEVENVIADPRVRAGRQTSHRRPDRFHPRSAPQRSRKARQCDARSRSAALLWGRPL